jgi:hypothetical protein
LEMGEAEVAHFLSSLARDAHVSASTQNQALNASSSFITNPGEGDWTDPGRRSGQKTWVASLYPMRLLANTRTRIKSGGGSGSFRQPAIISTDSQGRSAGIISMNRFCKKRLRKPGSRRESLSLPRAIHCGIPLPRTYWRTGRRSQGHRQMSGCSEIDEKERLLWRSPT